MAEERKHHIRHVLDQVIAAQGDYAPRDDVRELAKKVQNMRNAATIALSSIYADFGKVTGPEAADLDALKQVEAFKHLADLTDDLEKRTNAFIAVVMSQVTAYKVPPPGDAVTGEIEVKKIEPVTPTP
jgi:hypothetical protein